MSPEQIAAKVFELAGEQAGLAPSQITAATHFVNDLNFDSLDRVEFAMALEDEFEIAVSDEDAEKLHSVGEVIDYVVGRLTPAPAA